MAKHTSATAPEESPHVLETRIRRGRFACISTPDQPVKHFAFTRCGEFNVYGMVDAQIAVVEGELLAKT